MYCRKCGSLVDENGVCPNCKEIAENVNHVNRYSGLSIAGFVISLVGLLIAAIPCGIVGVICSLWGKAQVEDYKLKGNGLAISGIAVSIVDIILGFLWL